MFDYGDPIIIKKRAGSGLDPYIYYDEQYLIINNKVVLKEIPDRFQGVVVTNYFYTKSSTPASNEFTCDFTNGILTFNSTENNKIILAKFWGTGVVYWASSRVYIETDGESNVIETLKEYTNRLDTNTSNFVNKGNFLSTQTYYVNNIVLYNGSSYMCILESLNNLPTNLPTQTTVLGCNNFICCCIIGIN